MRRLLLPALAAMALNVAAQPTVPKSDWELQQEKRNWKDEGEASLPAYPKAGDLIEFFVSAASSFKFFVDARSLAVGAGAVRYTLVARSPSGAETVSYEGIRCGDAGMVRVYAFGNAGTWSVNKSADWRPIEPKSVQRWHNELRGSYFCPNGVSIYTAAEGLDALRRGGHPSLAVRGPGRL